MTINLTMSEYQHHTHQDVKAKTNSHSSNSTLYPSKASFIYMIFPPIVIRDESMTTKVTLCSLLSPH